MAVTLMPLSEPLGVEVTGIDLSQPLDPEARQGLEDALIENMVMVVRDQDLSPAGLETAVGHFGPLMQQHLTSLLMEGHPKIVVLDSAKTKVGADGKFVPIGARDWHTDHAHQERPPNYSALYAVRLPPKGGDTGFANMQMGYARLGPDKRAELARHVVVTKIDDRYSTAKDRAAHREARTHPLIRTHPVTGRQAIFFHPGMVDHLEGMCAEASRTYLEELLEEVIAPEITYRHEWRSGDLVIMDNRGMMHIAHRDYDPMFGRILHRVLVEGEVPY
jgi:taurine dioxygenase